MLNSHSKYFVYSRDPVTPKGGALLLGGIDEKHYSGELSYVKANGETGFWEINVDKWVCATLYDLSNIWPYIEGGDGGRKTYVYLLSNIGILLITYKLKNDLCQNKQFWF